MDQNRILCAARVQQEDLLRLRSKKNSDGWKRRSLLIQEKCSGASRKEMRMNRWAVQVWPLDHVCRLRFLPRVVPGHLSRSRSECGYGSQTLRPGYPSI